MDVVDIKNVIQNQDIDIKYNSDNNSIKDIKDVNISDIKMDRESVSPAPSGSSPDKMSNSPAPSPKVGGISAKKGFSIDSILAGNIFKYPIIILLCILM